MCYTLLIFKERYYIYLNSDNNVFNKIIMSLTIRVIWKFFYALSPKMHYIFDIRLIYSMCTIFILWNLQTLVDIIKFKDFRVNLDQFLTYPQI